jgi:YggT family protein
MIDAMQVVEIIAFFLQAVAWLLIARSLLSWFPDLQRYQVVRLLYDITDPIIQPLRRLIPPIGFLDISVMIAVMFLFVLSAALLNAAN